VFDESGSLSGAVKHPGAFRAWLKKKPGESVTSADIARGQASEDPHVKRMAGLAKGFKTIRSRKKKMREGLIEEVALEVAREALLENMGMSPAMGMGGGYGMGGRSHMREDDECPECGGKLGECGHGMEMAMGGRARGRY
jgi:hypothetical protein